MKVYTIPKFSRTLTKALKDGEWEVVRNSKSVITLTRSGLLARNYKFHLNFEAKCVDTINLCTRCSGYKNVTIALKAEDMKMLVKLEAAFNKMLQANEITESKVEAADNE